VVNYSADVTSSERSFVCGPATGKAQLPTVDSLLVGTTTRRLMLTERSDRRLGRSATRLNRPRYPAASPYNTIQYNIRLLKLDRMQADNTGSGYA